MMSLLEARQQLREQVMHGEGGVCPCCKQFTKIYKRPINSTMARSLIKMYRVSGTEWFHMPTVLNRKQADEAKLRYWGLLEERTAAREDGGRAGWWRITGMGARFVQGSLTVQRYALIYDGGLLRLDGEQVSIRDCLGARFSYEELMAARFEDLIAARF